MEGPNRRRPEPLLSTSHSALSSAPARPWIGSAFVLLSAVSFGLITTQSRLAYDGGSTPITLVLARSATFAILFGAVLLLYRRRQRLTIRAFVATLWMAVLLVAMSAGYLSSVAYIPVSLAALIFYSFPLYVAVLSSLSGREAMTRLKAAALLVAFVGLVLALGPSFDHLDWRGILCAEIGALAFATSIAFGGPVMRRHDPLLFNVCTNLWEALAVGTYVLAYGGFALPTGGRGWTGLTGSILCYLVALTAWFISLRLVGPIRVAILFNIEPIVTIAAAWIVLGERLDTRQLLGAGLVIAAVAAMTTFGASRPADAASAPG